MTNSSKLYPNYFRMASKRLSSCSHMLELYKTDATRKEVLHDIYYLSGYILEGFVIYSIYKTYRWDEDLPIDDKESEEELRNIHLSFYKNGKSWQTYFIQGHNFQSYVEVIRKHPDFHDLPFFSSARRLDKDTDNLINKWNPEIRYMFDSIPLSIDKLEKLLDFCSIVKQYIIKRVGVDPDYLKP